MILIQRFEVLFIALIVIHVNHRRDWDSFIAMVAVYTVRALLVELPQIRLYEVVHVKWFLLQLHGWGVGLSVSDLMTLRLQGAWLLVMAYFFRCLELFPRVRTFLLSDVSVDLTLITPE